MSTGLELGGSGGAAEYGKGGIGLEQGGPLVAPLPTQPPIVTSISPAPGTALQPQQAVSFNVTSPAGRSFSAMVILAQYPNIGPYEVVHDGVNFSSNYFGTKSAITNGFSFAGVLRRGGWPSSPTIVPIAVDSAGLVNG